MLNSREHRPSAAGRDGARGGARQTAALATASLRHVADDDDDFWPGLWIGVGSASVAAGEDPAGSVLYVIERGREREQPVPTADTRKPLGFRRPEVP